MLFILLAWIYITFLCWTWGILFLHGIKKLSKDVNAFPPFSITCITGLSIITIIAGILSLFIPLGEWWVQFVFILPALSVYFIKDIPWFFSSLRKEFSLLSNISLIFLCSVLLLILLMSSWTIVHPDTLGYHAQTMQWIEKYKAVPGLVHLHVRFGYQGMWFVDAALFDFSFTGTQGITFLNSAILFWFLLFMINRIDHNFFKDGKKITGLLWLVLLALSFWSYTQVRLTATSASPDFIATIFVLAIIYLLLERDLKHLQASSWIMVALLSVVAVTIKLSVAPILLIALVASLLFLIKRKFKAFFLLLFISILSFSGFVGRNIITSGYVVFPTTAVDIVNVDWKYRTIPTANEKNYITAYAKKYGVSTKEEIDTVNNMSIGEWLPDWWRNRSIADKTIIILLLVSLIGSLLVINKIIQSGFIPLLVLITMLAGIIFWFIIAPDPRFGFGFILGFISLVAYRIFIEKNLAIGKKMLTTVLIIVCLGTLTYTGYRFKNFFDTDQLISPLGIPPAQYKTIKCGEIDINNPINAELGIIPVPCSDLNCDNFSPRGNKIEDGFKANQDP